jgi:putative nucleotidyltransferase with HDIG domain
MVEFEKIKSAAIENLLIDKEKEWHCHVKFVLKIATELAARYGGNMHVIKLAAILHDIGRGREFTKEDHLQAGYRVAKDFFKKYEISKANEELILKCIVNHSAEEEPDSLEERIIITADSASKIQHHQAFMLMVKKEDYRERAKWGVKYLDKGYKLIQFENYRDEIQSNYELYRSIYDEVISNV